MRQIALDLETMSTQPNAAITAIGMVEFDLETDATREFYTPVHLATSVKAGGIMDPEAVLFWMGEDLLEARRKMLFSAMPIEMALQAANEFMMESSQGQDLIVWANGPQFDCVILRSAMERIGKQSWWNYYNERDVRTLKRLYPSIELPEFEGIKHFALDDARHEMRTVKAIYAALNGRKSLPATGTSCPECGQPQFQSPSGLVCANGHGFGD